MAIFYRSLTEAAKQPTVSGLGFEVYVLSHRATGHTPKIILAPKSMRLVHTGLVIETEGVVATAAPDLLKKGIFIPGMFIAPTEEELCIPMYNCGLVAYYLEHGELLARLHHLRLEKK